MFGKRLLLFGLLSVSLQFFVRGQESPAEELRRRYQGVTLETPGGLPPGANARIGAELATPALGARDITRSIGRPEELRPVEIRVTHVADVGAVGEVVRAKGGSVRATYETSLFADLPAAALNSIADLPTVHSISGQAMFTSVLAATNGRGNERSGDRGLDVVQSIGVSPLHKAEIRGRGVRIGIIDFGFQRYAEMVSKGRLPKYFASRTFNQSGRIEGDGWGEVHGTACAEIVHDIAPDSELLLAAIDGRSDSVFLAAEWLLSQGVRIITFSGGTSIGPLDGRAWLDVYINRISTQRGVLWVSSAGNKAASHWSGDASRHDRQGWVNIGSASDDKLFIEPDGTDIAINIVWDDWGPDPLHPSGTQAIDAALYRMTSGPQLISESIFSPGRLSPVIQFRKRVNPRDTYALRLRARQVTRSMKLHVFVEGGRVMPSIPAGSVSIPATGASALVVGAVHIKTGLVERYSSLGPTDGGLEKPDLTAYDYTDSIVYRDGFHGTSAAAPAAAGLAALLLQTRPRLAGPALREAILQYVHTPPDAIGQPGYGRGVLDAALLPAVPNTGLTTSVPLPEDFGGPTTASVLDNILHHAGRLRPFAASVELDRQGTRRTYKYGDPMRLTLRCSEDCIFVLLSRSSDGKYEVLRIPNAALGSGASRQLDGIARPPGGSQQLILIAAKHVLRTEQLADPVGLLSTDISVGIAEYSAGP